jgi:hypothetical protein
MCNLTSSDVVTHSGIYEPIWIDLLLLMAFRRKRRARHIDACSASNCTIYIYIERERERHTHTVLLLCLHASLYHKQPQSLSMVLAKPTPYAKEDECGRAGQREGFYDRRREKGEDPTNCNTFF